MAIILCEAAIDENGQTGYEGSLPGDQNGNEVRNINYYPYRKGWVHVFRWKDRKIAERFAIRMQGAVVNDKIGYSQPKRYTYWDELKKSDYDPMKIKNPCECDCSSLVCANVNAALLEAGIKTNISPMEYTASMEKAFLNDKNFMDVISQVNLNTGEGLMVGDILLSPPQGHTASVYSVSDSFNKTPKWVGEVYNCITCTVYADGSKNTKLSEYPTLGQGNLVDVCDENNTRHYVRIAAKHYGWVEKKYLRRKEEKQRIGTTTTALYMREKPIDGKIILVIPAKVSVTITDEVKASNGVIWYKITYHGATGYASSRYIL